ncbi:MAG: hypothetical protein ACC656_05685 [Candidatus Heimdallarchaeota archaeon]
MIINYPDRLTRFGFGYLEKYFLSYGVKITILEKREITSVEQEMTDDLIAIITSFSGKIHGMRSRKYIKKTVNSDSKVPRYESSVLNSSVADINL